MLQEQREAGVPAGTACGGQPAIDLQVWILAWLLVTVQADSPVSAGGPWFTNSQYACTYPMHLTRGFLGV